jgi:hypothetical protein
LKREGAEPENSVDLRGLDVRSNGKPLERARIALSAPFGIPRRSGLRAVRDSGPFGIPRRSGSAPFGFPRPFARFALQRLTLPLRRVVPATTKLYVKAEKTQTRAKPQSAHVKFIA